MPERTFDVYSDDARSRVPVKAWTRGVPLEDKAKEQLLNLSTLPFIHRHVAVMPDVHAGIGSTVGSVIPTYGAIIPGCVGVDIGCGMSASRTTLRASDLPDSLLALRLAIEAAVPHGRTDNGGPNDRGGWSELPGAVREAWDAHLGEGYGKIASKHPRLGKGNAANHLGTLGTGNHFIEVCLDTEDYVWVMLHSGSRGVGNRFGQYFIEMAKDEMRRYFVNLPDADLAYLVEGTTRFDDYVEAVSWAQEYARINRALMMDSAMSVLSAVVGVPFLSGVAEAVSCHHNYVSQERHFGKSCWVTRKGAIRAGVGEMGIIPGSMGAKSFIVRGKGNTDSFCSCSHGAGRAMSRTEAKRRFTIEDHALATVGVECRKDADVVDETPSAYKSIDAVMAAQSDLVEVVHTLKQVVCVKG